MNSNNRNFFGLCFLLLLINCQDNFFRLADAALLVKNVISFEINSQKTSEGGGTATLSIVLKKNPASIVTLTFENSDSSEASLSVNSLVFTPLNWNTAQSVTITGINDSMVDGDVTFEVFISRIESEDGDFNFPNKLISFQLTNYDLDSDNDADSVNNSQEILSGSDPENSNSFYEEDTTRYTAMNAAGYIFIPGGWDVNGDGTIESGFYIMKYEAKLDTLNTVAASDADVPKFVSGSTFLDCPKYVDNTLASDNRIYNNSSLYFDIGFNNATSYNCGTFVSYNLTTQTFYRHIKSVAAGTPLDQVNWFVGRSNCRATKNSANINIDLPTNLQYTQLTALIINNGQNWTSGSVGTGTIFRGHTDNAPANALAADTDDNNGYSGTGDSNISNPEQKRTFMIREGTTVRKCQSANSCAETFTLSSNALTTHVKTGYTAVIWDISGNIIEISRDLIHQDDRFDEMSTLLWQEWNTVSAPLWLKPILADGTILGSTATYGIGQYKNALTVTGAQDPVHNIGYGAGDTGLYAVFLRGGSYKNTDTRIGALGSISTEFGLSHFGSNDTSFRCAQR